MDNIFKPKTITLSNGKVVTEKKSNTLLISIILLAFLIISLRITGFNSKILAKNGRNLFVILKDLFNPDWDYLPKVIGPTIDTIKMSLFGSFLGALFSLPIAFLAASNMVNNKFINWFFKLVFTIFRTLPTLVIALIATYVFGLGTLAGTFAIFIFSFAYVGKIMYEEIETQDLGAYEAMISMGYTRTMAFLKGVIPSIMATYISTSLFNFEGNVRYASILGYVGAGGLGLLINENIGWRDYNRVGTILFALVITVFVIELISRTIRKRLS
ncbi:phosphonate ABC transporter, permease protein PhnE [uncultured Anaerococcus sp.]|uniref:phosphonate ABC transporter, permease protein PhnE n=1 Tax=Anaerococcus sp. AH8042_DFU013_CI05 TaxID=3385202 RepID=UPI0025DB3CF6|nr:phosphonate ABC transporter, permease protein PhnE [uncultured Anaerococcus sp.]